MNTIYTAKMKNLLPSRKNAPRSSDSKALPPTPDDLLPSMAALNVSEPPSGTSARHFVGGFITPMPSAQHNYRSSPSRPHVSMAMPEPHIASHDTTRHGGAPSSLTMQYALNYKDVPRIPSQLRRPSLSTSDLPDLDIASPISSQKSSPAKPTTSVHNDDTLQVNATPSPSLSAPINKSSKPQPRRRASASSADPSLPSKPDVARCAATTKSGKPCSRTVKTTTALSDRFGDESDADDDVERFCFQHSKEIMSPSGFYARKNATWIKFDDWIPTYLQSETQIALRTEMEKARSLSDKDGYIYIFEIRDPQSPNTIKLKVGRAVNLTKRIDEWSKQCKSKEQALRGWYPGIVYAEDGVTPLLDHELHRMKGRVRAGVKGACCHRLERLIHLELSDIISTGLYMHAAWPSVTPTAASSSSSPPKSKQRQVGTCTDCGKKHKEIFEFARIQKGHYVGREWEGIVRPIVEKWGGFVEAFV